MLSYILWSLYSLSLLSCNLSLLSLSTQWRRQWQPTPVLLPRKSHGWRSLMGCSPWGHDWATSLSLFTFKHWRRKWQPTPVFLPGESQERRSLVGCRLWGYTESDTTEATQQQQQQFSSTKADVRKDGLKKEVSFLFSENQESNGVWVVKMGVWGGIPTSLVAQLVKNLPAMQETWVLSLGWEDALEKGKATHSSILAWRIPRASKFHGMENSTGS